MLPTPPAPFGSYDPADVTWLLTDLSDIDLERGTEDREEAIQGGVHYSEMLPVEYQPDDAYLNLYRDGLSDNAARLAVAVGVVGEQIVAAHKGQPPVLVSLARAGTPVGVLIKRYIKHAHDIDAPHYTISIIRGKGIDEVALAYILDRHPATAIRFVDGWTGKGAIQKQLTEAVTAYNASHGTHIDDALAVLADPGSCTTFYGTRDDFLIPSACLNSTVSGLVSRTVLRDDLISPGTFHGAKFYSNLATADVSREYVDTITSQFSDVSEDVALEYKRHMASDRTPKWTGWRSVLDVGEEYGINDINLIKPGVGETTRVLLRRVPWKILMHPERKNDLTHVLALADDRNVPVEYVDHIQYSCIGIIKPVTESAAQ